MASERSEDATKGPRPSKSRSFHWTSGLSIIECSHGYTAQTKFKFIVHVYRYIRRTYGKSCRASFSGAT